jgi:hypothetical protein
MIREVIRGMGRSSEKIEVAAIRVLREVGEPWDKGIRTMSRKYSLHVAGGGEAAAPAESRRRQNASA